MKIFLLHIGRHPYVRLALQELLKCNKKNDIILFTDDKQLGKDYFGFDILYENISDYFTLANQFKDIYVHKSKNPYKYELLCLQRRLVFFEYMEQHNIEECWQVDSDVLVFCNLEDYSNKYLKDYNFCCVASSGGTFYGKKKGLSQFKDFLFDAYQNKLDVLDGFYKKQRYPINYRNNGFIEHEKTWCVSDMTLFYLFIKGNINGVKYKDIGIINDNTVFDDNINRGVGFNHGKYLKSIVLINNKYYGTLEGKESLKILFNCLHFQGNSKYLMPYFASRSFGLKYYLYLYCLPVIIYITNKLGIHKFLIKIYHKIKK